MQDTDDEQTGEYDLPQTGAGSWTAHPRDRFRVPKMYGLPIHTDRWGLLVALEQIAFEAETLDEDEVSHAFVNNPSGAPPTPPDPTKLVNRLPTLYPGLQEAVVRGMKELDARGVRAGHIVFLNGRVQVWPEALFAHVPPSDFYPTQCAGAPGFEVEIEAAAKAREEAVEREHQVAMAKLEDEFLTALAVKPRELLENVRTLAVHYKRMGLTDGPLTPLIRKHVLPWLTGGADNRTMAEQVLGPVHYGNDDQPAGPQEDCRWILEA